MKKKIISWIERCIMIWISMIYRWPNAASHGAMAVEFYTGVVDHFTEGRATILNIKFILWISTTYVQILGGGYVYLEYDARAESYL